MINDIVLECKSLQFQTFHSTPLFRTHLIVNPRTYPHTPNSFITLSVFHSKWLRTIHCQIGKVYLWTTCTTEHVQVTLGESEKEKQWVKITFVALKFTKLYKRIDSTIKLHIIQECIHIWNGHLSKVWKWEKWLAQKRENLDNLKKFIQSNERNRVIDHRVFENSFLHSDAKWM